jgi:NADPH2 dehydrogenase
MANSRLFQPLEVGKLRLNHRVAMAPLTRYRASDEHVPTDMMAEYYSQRASVPGTLLVSEATFISAKASGYNNVPGMYTDEQISAWKKVTDAVHAKGSSMFCQLRSLGRVANPDVATKEGITIMGPSNIPLEGRSKFVKPMTMEDIQQAVRDYASAAKNAIEAGFDAVEGHGANGYLIDQFIQDVTNPRTDGYGGSSIETRSRLAVEVVEAISAAIGADRVGIRLSPHSRFQGMGMKDPLPQFSDVIRKLSRTKMAYLHLIEDRAQGGTAVAIMEEDRLDWAISLWDGPILIAGGYKPQMAKELVDDQYPNKDIIIIIPTPIYP